MSTVNTPLESDLEPPGERIAIERHRRGNRWMHWLNFPLLTVMIWSGLRILWADLRDPFVFGIGGWEIFEFLPDSINEPLDLDRKLARGMAFHFTFGWLFLINGATFAAYLTKTRGWKNFIPTRDDLKTIPAVLLHECGIRKEAPPQGKYNGVQQLTYGAVLVMGFLAIVSGFAIYRPTQLAPLTALFGGYSGARFVHFSVTIGFILFFGVHIVQVARAGLAGLFSMITGYELLRTGAEPRHSYTETRVNARLRDLVWVVLVPASIVLFLASLDSEPNPGWMTRIVVFSVILGFLWDVAWTALRGATPGKQSSGLRVVKRGTEETPNPVQALLRGVTWAPLVPLALGWIWAGIALGAVMFIASVLLIRYDSHRRSPADLISGTEVVAVSHLEQQVTAQ